MTSLYRDKVEKEERKTLAAAGCNVTERVFSAEEVITHTHTYTHTHIHTHTYTHTHCYLSTVPYLHVCMYIIQLSGKLITERRRFQLGVCEVRVSVCACVCVCVL